MRSFSYDEFNQLQGIVVEILERQVVFETMLRQIGHPIAPEERESDFKSQVFRMLYKGQMNGWILRLIDALLTHSPTHEALLKLAEKAGMAARSESNLEALTSSISSFQDLGKTLSTLHRLERQICRVEINKPSGKKSGTGFLVGPDLVLTNYHVVEDLINKVVQTEQVIVRFDFKTVEGEKEDIIYKGTEYQLKKESDPVLASSPYSKELDPKNVTLNQSWPEDHLDYALLQLENKAGMELPGQLTRLDGSNRMPRGWIPFPISNFTLRPEDLLVIIQHPEDKPITWSFHNEAVIGLNPNEQRVRYRVNTKKGSSGSPCFNGEWNLVALHHAGDPSSWNPGYNQGIPIMKIFQSLKNKGLKNRLTIGELTLEPLAPPPPATSPTPQQVDPEKHFKAVFLNEVSPFIPRTLFNRAIKGMILGLGSRVILLNGQERTGLTYSYNFIQQAAEHHGYHCLNFSLKRLFSDDGTARSLPLARHLVTKMNINYTLPDDEEFKLTGFTSSFTGAVASSERKFLIFLDDLSSFPMTTECANFIKTLAVTIQLELQNVRLILAGFEEPLPIEIMNVTKKVVMKSFSINDLDKFFAGFYHVLPALIEKNLEEPKDEFVQNSKEMVKDNVNLAKIPNVEEVGSYVRKHCDWLIENS